MKELIIEGSKYYDIKEIHQFFAKEFGWGFYGKNLDALWDFLTTDVERPFIIRWVDIEESKKRIGNDCINMLNLLREVEDWDKEHFKENKRFHLIVE